MSVNPNFKKGNRSTVLRNMRSANGIHYSIRDFPLISDVKINEFELFNAVETQNI